MDEFQQLALQSPALAAAPSKARDFTPEESRAATAKWQADQAKEKREREAAAWGAAYVRESGVTGKFLHQATHTFQCNTAAQRTAFDACQQIIDTLLGVEDGAPPLKSLWLLGPPGTGKTHLGSALVTELWIDWGYACHITTPSRLIRRLRATWSKGSEQTEDQVLHQLAALDLLVLDDIGTGWGTPGEQSQIAEVIDLRWTRGGSLVITSNLDVDALRTELGPRTVDRLRDGARLVPLTGESFRKPHAEGATVLPLRKKGGS